MWLALLPLALASAPSPLDSATSVHAQGGVLNAWHATDLDVATRDRLWDDYVAWAATQGYAPSRKRQQMPWQKVRWQRFERGDEAVELQIRRKKQAGGWWVQVIPKTPGALFSSRGAQGAGPTHATRRAQPCCRVRLPRKSRLPSPTPLWRRMA